MEEIASISSSMAVDDTGCLASLQPSLPRLEPYSDASGADSAGTAVAEPAAPSPTPLLGMEFDSVEAARAFYCAHAAAAGFRVRSGKSFTSRVDDAVIMRRFVCSRQGHPARKDDTGAAALVKRRNRPSLRDGCGAMMQVNHRSESGRWVVSRLVLDHSHPLGLPLSLLDASTSSRKLQKTVLCEPQPHFSLSLCNGVMHSLLECFKRKQVENPGFCFAVQLNNYSRVENVFWADARARMYCHHFADAISLDVSCRHDNEMRPLVVLTGMNHHHQMVVLGCALLINESVESLVWLLESWLAMEGQRRPMTVTTGYNNAFEAASLQVFPDALHRFSKRDIFSKCKENLFDVHAKHASFRPEFKKCVNECDGVEEFESSWKALIDRYNLSDNYWLQVLYSIRHKWVPAYVKGGFLGELSGRSKLENIQDFFRRNSITATTLHDLVVLFDKAVARQHESEIMADVISSSSRPVMKTAYPLEKQASEVYTRAVFELFQDELVDSCTFIAERIDNGVTAKFTVAKIGNERRACFVNYSNSDKIATCSCRKFEVDGILCRHALRVLILNGVLVLPDNYFLKRWTMNAKKDAPLLAPGDCRRPMPWRCNDLYRDVVKLAEEGATSEMMHRVAKEALRKASDEVFAARGG